MVNENSDTGGPILRTAMIAVVLGVLLILPSQALAAGGGWQTQKALTAQNLYGIAATSGDQAWTVGAAGTIVATKGGATSWVAQASTTTQDLRAVAFADSSHGWAVGDGGTILQTSDGGATWAVQASHDSRELEGVAFSDPAHGWIVGADGTIIHTSDGGGAWAAQASNTMQDLAGVAFADAEHGLVAGADATIRTTGDGGIHDTVPPRTIARGLRANRSSGWRNRSQTVTLHASDSGSGVAATCYTLDGGPRQTYQAPFSVFGAGSHLVKYWSVDWAGNVEAKHTGFVNIDTSKPVCVALGSVRTWSGTVASLAYRVSEPSPNCGKAFVTLTLNRQSRPVKRIKLSRVQLNQRHVYAFTVRLRAGSYTWVVTATDVAGNTQASEGKARLQVVALPLPTVADVQRRLVALKYLPAGAVSGRSDYRTSQALLAFQAWNGLPRDGVVDVQTRTRLAIASPPRPRSEPVSGHYVEVFRSLGVALCVDSGSLVRAVHCSTGRPSLPTPAGQFSVYSKSLDAFSAEYDSWMPYASFFHGGDALHGYPDVPAYPASHGCVRLSMPEAPWVYAFATLGTPVFVY